jgi:hypothetical protein
MTDFRPRHTPSRFAVRTFVFLFLLLGLFAVASSPQFFCGYAENSTIKVDFLISL